ncbi:MAG: histidine phosphatase family protein [Loktanella sp.]|nr:histidine phosphatase family protein [Loktanella sp.]
MIYPELYILRHGQTAWNAEGRMQGWLDSPLTPQGLRDAARQHEILQAHDLTGFTAFSSPLGRALETAAIAVTPFIETIHEDDRLREIGVGDWQGELRDSLPRRDTPDWVFRQYEDAPNGEGFDRLRLRVTAFLNALPAPAVLVTHGITSRMIRSVVVGEAALQVSTPNGGQGMVWHVKDGAQHLLR